MGSKVTRAHAPLGLKGSTWRLIDGLPGNGTKVRLRLGLAVGRDLSEGLRPPVGRVLRGQAPGTALRHALDVQWWGMICTRKGTASLVDKFLL